MRRLIIREVPDRISSGALHLSEMKYVLLLQYCRFLVVKTVQWVFLDYYFLLKRGHIFWYYGLLSSVRLVLIASLLELGSRFSIISSMKCHRGYLTNPLITFRITTWFMTAANVMANFPRVIFTNVSIYIYILLYFVNLASYVL